MKYLLEPLAYQGRVGCENQNCRREMKVVAGRIVSSKCVGWHCYYCDKPCSSQGHACPLKGESNESMAETTSRTASDSSTDASGTAKS